MRTTNKAIIIITTFDGTNPANVTSIDFVADDLWKIVIRIVKLQL